MWDALTRCSLLDIKILLTNQPHCAFLWKINDLMFTNRSKHSLELHDVVNKHCLFLWTVLGWEQSCKLETKEKY